MSDRPSICYLVGHYPAVSHTFIDREIQAVRAAGIDVWTVSLRRVAPSSLLTEHDRNEADRTWSVLPPSPVGFAASHTRTLLKSPKRYFGALAKALGLGAPGLKGAIWKVFWWAEAVYLADALSRRGIRHTHAHFANSASWVSMLAADLTGGTWSLTMHGPSEFDDVHHFALRQKVRSAEFVACIGDYCQSQLQRTVEPAFWDRFEVVRCGVDGEAYKTEGEARFPTDGPTKILTVGRLVPDKGQRVLLDAIAVLKRRSVETQLTVVGDGPDRAALEEHARSLNISADVTFEGSVGQDRLPDLYRDHDIFALASFAEGIPVVLMEAMACRIPVIAPSIMGIGELVEPERTGTLVLPNRSDLLADAIEHVLKDPSRTSRLVDAAASRVSDAFTYPQAADPLVKRFRAVTDRGALEPSV